MARKAAKGKPASFEQALDKLERIVDKLELGEETLDESLKLYEQGVKALELCHGILEKAEHKIEQLVKESGSSLLKKSPFAAESNNENEDR